MTEQSDDRLGAEWGWIRDPDFTIGGCLLFARGASADQVIQAFGMDPAAAVLLPLDRSSDALRYPVMDERLNVLHPWIRAGRDGEWGFAVSQGSVNVFELSAAARELSAGTDVATFQWTLTIDNFKYLADGTVVTAFEPLLSHERTGTEPDRFLPLMKLVGLMADPDDDDLTLDPRTSLLEILTMGLGIRLTSDVVRGPLLTVQRG